MNADADAVRVRIQRLRGALPLPTYETPGAAGMDLRAEIDAAIVLDVGERVRVGMCWYWVAATVWREWR